MSSVKTSSMVNQYGRPFADYEQRWLDEPSYYTHLDAVTLLDFRVAIGTWEDIQAVYCETCGALFIDALPFMISHRQKCGWDNGQPAIEEAF